MTGQSLSLPSGLYDFQRVKRLTDANGISCIKILQERKPAPHLLASIDYPLVNFCRRKAEYTVLDRAVTVDRWCDFTRCIVAISRRYQT